MLGFSAATVTMMIVKTTYNTRAPVVFQTGYVVVYSKTKEQVSTQPACSEQRTSQPPFPVLILMGQNFVTVF